MVTIPLMHLDSCTLPTREGEEVKCEYCGEMMTPGSSFYGDYCPTRQCFNSELERVYRGPRYLRRRERVSI